MEPRVARWIRTARGIYFLDPPRGLGLDDFAEMRKVSKDEVLVTSDVTGMDFCLGGLVAAYPYYATLCETTKSEDFKRAAMSFSYCEADPIYLIERECYRQAGHSTCQTGSALTSIIDTVSRTVDTVLKEGVLSGGKRYKLSADWVSPLVERDIKTSRPGDPVDWCGRGSVRAPGQKDHYKLNKANNLLMKLVDTLVQVEQSDPGNFETQLELIGKMTSQYVAARFGADSLQERAKRTLVLGGWGEPTSRKALLASLDKAFGALSLNGYLDTAPFTTGARRSVALLPFHEREHESFYQMKQRMTAVVEEVRRASYVLDARSGKTLWAGYSKSKSQRTRGSHAARCRRVIKVFDERWLDELDVEYDQGEVWHGGVLLCSAVAPVPVESEEGDVIRLSFESDTAWVNVRALAGLLHVTSARVLQEWESQQRGVAPPR